MFRDRNRLISVEALRGLASVAVAWYHLTQGNAHFLNAGVVKNSGAYGWLGVEVFFVISGFVIPFSLWRSQYQVRDFGRFVCKRIARLDPPYGAAIIVILTLGWLSAQVPGYGGPPFSVSWTQIGLHVAYLNVLFGGDAGKYPWLSPVFWTLAIEFQFYLSIGILYPLFASANRRWLGLLVAATCLYLAAIVPSSSVVIHYAPLFLTGITLFQYRAGVIEAPSAVIALLGLAIATAALLGPVIAAVCLLTAITIAVFDTGHRALHRALSFLGSISYSLYLLHIPIGGRIVNFGARYAESAPAQWAILAAAVVASIAAAWVFAQLIELPSQRLASGLALHNRPGPSNNQRRILQLGASF